MENPHLSVRKEKIHISNCSEEKMVDHGPFLSRLKNSSAK